MKEGYYLYRSYYLQKLNLVDLPKNFEVHHIDRDNTNNDIENLVALPIMLHRRLHQVEKNIPDHISIYRDLKSIIDVGCNSNEFTINVLNEYLEVYKECCKWVDYRNYLMGYIPNIHNLKYQDID